MRDIVIGSITGYDFEAIKPWVNSLERSGFTGMKAMLCYNIKQPVIDELAKRNFTIFAFEQNADGVIFTKPFNIVVERFYHMWLFLKDTKQKYNLRYLIAPDVRDVLFQENPSAWLEKNIGDKKIIAPSESIAYEHETWGQQNLLQSYGGDIYSAHCKHTITNAGTIAGEIDTMLDLFLTVYLASKGGASVNPDQAALNIILNTKTYRDITYFAPANAGWACQAGVTADPKIITAYRPHLTEAEPVFDGQVVRTQSGEAFTLVHQYDRVPAWRDALLKKYS
ncbi:MAG: hypothetical protein EB059_11550 [Alphaproteobacteria bacterium]|nr:hypothetical protein [Alphaproteobacteria bacterium]